MLLRTRDWPLALTKEKLLISWMKQQTVKIMILGSPETMRDVNLETANTDLFFLEVFVINGSREVGHNSKKEKSQREIPPTTMRHPFDADENHCTEG